MAPLRPLRLSGRPSKMRSSIFSYPITRPYPFRWFTPVVVLGFLAFTALFTFINFVTTGYTLVVSQSSNPNATVRTQTWQRRLPSFLTNKVQPTCETVNLPLGSEFFTNQTALTYTLTDVWQPQSGGAGAGYGISPSLTYYSNVLESCNVSSVEIDYAAMDRTASQFAYSEWGAVVRTYTTCSIVGTNGMTNFNLTQEYDYVPSDLSFSSLYTFLGTNFLSRNRTTKSSLFWGESILSMYWTHSNFQMQTIRENQTSNNLPGIRKGTLYFYPNDDTTVTNMTDPNFFEVDFRFIVDRGLGNFTQLYPGTYGVYNDYRSLSNLQAIQAYPNIWQEADVLAKAAYSTVMTDLGQVNAKSNMLTDPTLLHYFTSNFSSARHNIANAYPGPAAQQYGTENSGPLGTTPSVISAKYLCQVPQRKGGWNLFISILVADLVFLQTLWVVWIFLIDGLLMRKHPERNHCEACAANPERLSAYRGVSPSPVPYGKGAEAESEVELGGLRPSARSRGSGSHMRSTSQQRLIGPGLS